MAVESGGISIGLRDLSIFDNFEPSQTLDLSRRELTQVPEELVDSKDLQVQEMFCGG